MYIQGTHWLMEIVYLVLTNGEMDKINRVMMEQGLEFSMCAGPSEVPKTKPGYKYMEEWPSPRVMVTHLMHRFMPPQVWEKKAKVRLAWMFSIIHVVETRKTENIVNSLDFIISYCFTSGDVSHPIPHASSDLHDIIII